MAVKLDTSLFGLSLGSALHVLSSVPKVGLAGVIEPVACLTSPQSHRIAACPLFGQQAFAPAALWCHQHNVQPVALTTSPNLCQNSMQPRAVSNRSNVFASLRPVAPSFRCAQLRDRVPCNSRRFNHLPWSLDPEFSRAIVPFPKTNSKEPIPIS